MVLFDSLERKLLDEITLIYTHLKDYNKEQTLLIIKKNYKPFQSVAEVWKVCNTAVTGDTSSTATSNSHHDQTSK